MSPRICSSDTPTSIAEPAGVPRNLPPNRIGSTSIGENLSDFRSSFPKDCVAAVGIYERNNERSVKLNSVFCL